jgi:uncharacterized protein
MKPLYVSAGLCALIFVSPVLAQKNKPSPKNKLSSKAARKPALTGVYEGKLVLPNSITLRLYFSFDAKGNLTIDSPDEELTSLNPKSFSIQKKIITIDGPGSKWTFSGAIDADRKPIIGTFNQNGAGLPMTLTPVAKIAVLNRPQTPKPPFDSLTEELSIPNPKAAGVTLSGTLTTPKGTGPFPAVVFITGSGPQDRDETIFGHKAFFVLADYLAKRGIASLRCDDRGVAKSTGKFVDATSADFATDIEAAFGKLSTRPEIDPKRIGLIGHSEGGVIAPMIAATPENKIGFIVLLAGPGVRGDEVLAAQSAAILESMGQPESVIKMATAQQRKLFDIALSEPDAQKALAKMATAIGMPNVDGIPPAIKSQLVALTKPWFQFFIRFDPASALSKVRCPVLALNGTKDLQVIAKQNLPAIEKALKDGGNTESKIIPLDGLNHLFQHAKTGAASEYATNTETFSPEALKIIGDWIAARTK